MFVGRLDFRRRFGACVKARNQKSVRGEQKPPAAA